MTIEEDMPRLGIAVVVVVVVVEDEEDDENFKLQTVAVTNKTAMPQSTLTKER